MSSLPRGWARAELTDLVGYNGLFSDGDWIVSKDQDPNGPIRLLQLADIGDGIFLNKSRKFINEAKFEELRCTEINEGDVLVARMPAPLGRACLMPKLLQKCITVVDVAIIRPGTNAISTAWLMYFVNSPAVRQIIELFSSGTTRRRISRKNLGNIELPVPPIAEQKRIAAKLGTLLARIDRYQTRLDRVRLMLDHFRQAVLIAATSGTLTEDWREEMELSLDSWHTKSGAEIFSFITSGSRGWAKYYADSGAIFLRVGNLAHRTIKLDLNEIQYVNLPDAVEGKRTRIEIGDILISITADVGRVAFIREDIGEAYINQHLCLARQGGEYSGPYLAYYLASPLGGLAQLTEAQRGVTKAGVTLGDIRALSLQIPEREEQDEIVRRVEALFALADRLEARYQIARTQIEHLTPALLTKAFRGGLIPQDPNDEPASVLLERIQAERAAKPERPKRVTTRKPKRIRMTEESVKDAIRQLPEDMFSFDDLRNVLTGDYEQLKTILFTLLSEADPSISQVFDQSAQAIRFVRSPK